MIFSKQNILKGLWTGIISITIIFVAWNGLKSFTRFPTLPIWIIFLSLLGSFIVKNEEGYINPASKHLIAIVLCLICFSGCLVVYMGNQKSKANFINLFLEGKVKQKQVLAEIEDGQEHNRTRYYFEPSYKDSKPIREIIEWVLAIACLAALYYSIVCLATTSEINSTVERNKRRRSKNHHFN
ncbi:MAG: hypothetical protein EOO46_01420 [Flavobacterium sp.]|nr:MAG: hypothetical protein EOO46_01420 [Flavobacterium sp.]